MWRECRVVAGDSDVVVWRFVARQADRRGGFPLRAGDDGRSDRAQAVSRRDTRSQSSTFNSQPPAPFQLANMTAVFDVPSELSTYMLKGYVSFLITSAADNHPIALAL